jgi:hypothetical protein
LLFVISFLLVPDIGLQSKPEALEDIDRAIIILKIEKEALKKETDPASKVFLHSLSPCVFMSLFSNVRWRMLHNFSVSVDLPNAPC